MHTLMLISWLAAAPAAGDAAITVETHALAQESAQKPAPGAIAHAVVVPLMGMQATLDANGRVHYDCDEIGTMDTLRAPLATAQKER